jgi:hypothetical protein
MNLKPRHNPIALFLCRFVAVFVILVIPWPGLNNVYNGMFRTMARLVFAEQSGQRQLSFEAFRDDPGHLFDTRVVIVNHALMHLDGSGPVRNLDVSFRWQSTALLLALIIATPISWGRRWWAMFCGFLCLHCFMLASLYFMIWNESAEISLVTLSPFWKHTANGLGDALAAQLNIAVPTLIWILVTFRGTDWAALKSVMRDITAAKRKQSPQPAAV